MSIKYRTSAGTSASNFSDLVVKVGDTLPIGTEVDYDGQTAPAGWQEVDDPNVYSTSETKIGTWINGKPLYRKVVNYAQRITAGTVNIPHNISNIDFVIKKDLSMKWNNNNYTNPIVDTDTSKASYIKCVDNTNIVLILGETWDAYQMSIILEYTKTTD